MSVSTNEHCIYAFEIAVRQYRNTYNPWTAKPRYVCDGAAPFVASIRRGHAALRKFKDEITEIHLIDVEVLPEHGTRAVKGIRIYGARREFLMEFPELVLFGDGLAVAAAYELLKEIGLEKDAVKKIYELARRQPKRPNSQGLEMYNYILVIAMK